MPCLVLSPSIKCYIALLIQSRQCTEWISRVKVNFGTQSAGQNTNGGGNYSFKLTIVHYMVKYKSESSTCAFGHLLCRDILYYIYPIYISYLYIYPIYILSIYPIYIYKIKDIYILFYIYPILSYINLILYILSYTIGVVSRPIYKTQVLRVGLSIFSCSSLP